MRQITIAALALILIAGCHADPTSAQTPLVYASTAEAFVHEFTSGRSHDIDRSIAYLEDGHLGEAWIDLNDDGVDECIVSAMRLIDHDGEEDLIMGATGNGTAYLLRRQGQGWVVIMSISQVFHVREQTHGGWHDLETSWEMGGHDINTVYRWNGVAYEVHEKIVYEEGGE